MMRFLVCSAHPAAQEAAAQAIAHRSAEALDQRGFLARLRETFAGPTPAEHWHYQQVALAGAEAQRWAKGRLGEEILFHTLGHALDDRYLLLLGYPSPEQHGDLDGVLIGPHGVTVYEAKAWTGTFQASDTEWRSWSGRAGAWVPARGGNPIQQVRRHVASLRTLLRQAGLSSVPVWNVIALTTDQMQVQVTAPLSVPLLTLTRRGIPLQELLGSQGSTNTLAAELVQRVETALRAPLRNLPPPPPLTLWKTKEQLNQEGLALFQAGHYEAALARYQQALQMDPAMAVVQNNIAAALFELGRYPEALVASGQALQLDPRLASALINHGNILQKLARYQEAIAAFDQAIRLQPHLAKAYNGKGVALLELGNPQAALAELDEALTLDPTLAVTYHNKATALARLARRAEADQAEQQARARGYVPAPVPRRGAPG